MKHYLLGCAFVSLMLGGCGGSDSVSQPASLAARVRALLRRATRTHQIGSQETTQIIINQLRLDKLQRRTTLNDMEIETTAREFDLLWFFANNPGRVFNRSELLDNWNCMAA
jgi:two-component system, OmpR family, response regulator